ncbi:hypothetical protein SLS55_001492 [Diplodia seriata]|uniref:Uncharacterized protein n=1 Tax=Diplodia seriata TaxID=420778 RepID=A0ABR3CSM4_9PEZI
MLVDVRDVAGLNDVVKKIGDERGRLDGLVAAAGIQQETPALEYTASDANRMLEVNVTGAFMIAQAAAKQMIRFGRGGSIVLIASMSGTVANRVCTSLSLSLSLSHLTHPSPPHHQHSIESDNGAFTHQGLICPAYNASKAAVIQLARNLASEWGAAHGIRVNTISPGYIVTAMVEELFARFPERRRDWPAQNMLGRLSGPEEYRGAAVFLVSDASSFMTGADLRMDGGHAAW